MAKKKKDMANICCKMFKEGITPYSLHQGIVSLKCFCLIISTHYFDAYFSCVNRCTGRNKLHGVLSNNINKEHIFSKYLRCVTHYTGYPAAILYGTAFIRKSDSEGPMSALTWGPKLDSGTVCQQTDKTLIWFSLLVDFHSHHLGHAAQGLRPHQV